MWSFFCLLILLGDIRNNLLIRVCVKVFGLVLCLVVCLVVIYNMVVVDMVVMRWLFWIFVKVVVRVFSEYLILVICVIYLCFDDMIICWFVLRM